MYRIKRVSQDRCWKLEIEPGIWAPLAFDDTCSFKTVERSIVEGTTSVPLEDLVVVDVTVRGIS